MARVNVRDTAYHDTRLKVAAKAMGMNFERLGWRLIPVWSRVTEMNSPIVSLALLSADLGKPADIVAAGLIAGELAESVDEARLDLSPMMGALFEDYRWLARKRKDAGDDSPELSDHGPRDRALALLASGPLRRTELRKKLRIQRSKALGIVRELLADGLAVELDDGTIALACTVLGTAVSTDGPVPGTDVSTDRAVPITAHSTDDPVPGTDDPIPSTAVGTVAPVPGTNAVLDDRYPEPVPDASLAPARAPVLARASGAHTHARERTTGPEPPSFESLDSDELVPLARRRYVARLLWAYQEKCRAKLDPRAPCLPVDDAPGGSLDAVVLALAKYTPSACRHALDMFAAEGACIARDGGDALQFLNGRTNWKREQLDRAAGTTAAAIEKRFQSRQKRTASNHSSPQSPPMRSLDDHEP